MPKVSTKTLTFPLAGVVRAKGAREQDRPYSSPWAVNVRGVDSMAGRLRGGSRPGLAEQCDTDFSSISAVSEFSYVDGSGALQRKVVVVGAGACSVATIGGSGAVSIPYLGEGSYEIIAENGDYIVYGMEVDATVDATNAVSTATMSGKLFIADSTKLRVYDPTTGAITDVSGPPTGQTVVATYRGRIFLAGLDHLWHASRQADHTDWSHAVDLGDAGAPVSGQLESTMKIGEKITAMIPRGDASLTFATQNGMWLMNGDPATGRMDRIADGIGIVSPSAWDVSPDGVVLFVSGGGLYVYGLGSPTPPKSFSDDRLPEELKGIDTSANVVLVAYDCKAKGFHVSTTPKSTGTGKHYWVDLENKAIWPVVFGDDGMQPIAACRLSGSDLPDVLFGCKDGFLRKFSDAATDDDGTGIESHVLIGPIRLPSEDLSDGLLSEIHGVLGAGSGDVSWGIVTGSTAESAESAAVDAVGGTTTGVVASGTFSAGRGGANRPRSRGAWVVIWLHSHAVWAYEAIVLKLEQLGRLRV